MEEGQLFLGRKNNGCELDTQSGVVQFSFEFFGHPFRHAENGPGGGHFPLLAVPPINRSDTAGGASFLSG